MKEDIKYWEDKIKMELNSLSVFENELRDRTNEYEQKIIKLREKEKHTYDAPKLTCLNTPHIFMEDCFYYMINKQAIERLEFFNSRLVAREDSISPRKVEEKNSEIIKILEGK